MASSVARRWREKGNETVAEHIEEHVEESLSSLAFPESHRRRIRTTNGQERLNQEIKRRLRVARIFPNREACLRLVTALAVEQSEEWVTGRRCLYMHELEEQNSGLDLVVLRWRQRPAGVAKQRFLVLDGLQCRVGPLGPKLRGKLLYVWPSWSDHACFSAVHRARSRSHVPNLFGGGSRGRHPLLPSRIQRPVPNRKNRSRIPRF